MEARLPIRQPSLADQILQILRQRIKNQMYLPGSRLPPENQLADEFNVSRATVRSALDMLAASGMIVRRQGIGTFISRLSAIANPLNEFIDFNDLIRANDCEPGLIQLSAEFLDPEPEILKKLQIDPGNQVLHIHKVFTADEAPIIYCINNIPAWIFQDTLTQEEALQPGLTEPFFDFLEKTCSQTVNYSISSIQSDTLENLALNHTLDIEDPHKPFLIIEDIGYNENAIPVAHSVEYHPSNRMRFDIIRHRGRSVPA